MCEKARGGQIWTIMRKPVLLKPQIPWGEESGDKLGDVDLTQRMVKGLIKSLDFTL